MSFETATMARGLEKALLFGGLSLDYLREWEITSDLQLVVDKIGVVCEQVPHPELQDRYEALTEDERAEADEVAGALLRGAPPAEGGPPDEGKVRKAARLYVAMRQVTRQRGGHAVTLVGGPFYAQEDLPLPCLALTLMQEDGMPAACQGDLDALLTMMLLKRVSGWSSFMGGAYQAEGHLRITHDVLSRRIGGPDAPTLPHQLGTYHRGQADSPTVHTAVPVGQPVTVARLTRNLEHLIVASGAVERCADLPGHCRNTLVVDVPRLPELMAAVRGIQYHLVVGWGDHAAGLARLAREAGVGILPEETA